MDLGYGKNNQRMGNAAAEAILQTAAAQEAALTAQVDQYDALLEDETALQTLRARRLVQLKEQAAQQQRWMTLGHGKYTELDGNSDGTTHQNAADVAKAFFTASKESERLVVHFYRPTTRSCDVFHKHLTILAPQHKETRFVKINVENCDQPHGGGGSASFLVERLGIVVMPTLVLIQNQKVVHHIRGFDELGATEDFSTEALAYVLGRHGVLTLPDDAEVPPELLSPSTGINRIHMRR
jgi:hypothetical protein